MEIIEQAIRDLRLNYEEAKQDPHIKNPIAFALYSTWKQYDRRKK